MLDDLDHFVTFLQNDRTDLFAPPVGGTSCGVDHDDYHLYCSKCGAPRRMDVKPYWWTGGTIQIRHDANRGPAYWSAGAYQNEIDRVTLDGVLPSLYKSTCRQCEGEFTALIYSGPDGPDLVILPSRHGGLSTRNTPSGVAYYLDQAQRAHSVGANSAAVAMYRAALEFLLFEQGHEKGMLNAKIESLGKHSDDCKACKWATDLDERFLTVIKKLGDGAIHPNKGDITKQSVLDGKLIGHVQTTFIHLLFVVYELPQRKDSALAALEAPAKVLKK